MSTDEDIPFPSGNGDKDCPKCRGRGVVSIEVAGWPGGGAQNCDCVFRRDLLANVQRVWQVLLSAESVDSSPLLGLTRQSLWITASNYTLRRHLRHVAFRMGTKWDARVIADATLVTAWLSTAKNVHDADVLVEREKGKREKPSDTFMTLVDLAVPFDLLIIRLGVKAAANKEMPNVLLEAINERELIGKPTWVVDSPGHPLSPNHKCYSEDVIDLLDGFKRVVLTEDAPVTATTGVGQYHTRVQPDVSALPTGVMPVSVYTRHKESAYAASAPPTQAPKTAPVMPPPEDDDELSVSNLMAAAVNPTPVPPDAATEGETIPEFDPDEVISNYPSATDLRSNGTPAWLKKTLLTADARKAAQAQAKRDKKRGSTKP